jgi:hypothetical protein
VRFDQTARASFRALLLADEAYARDWGSTRPRPYPLPPFGLPQHLDERRPKSGPPRSRSATRRTCGSWDSPVGLDRAGSLEVGEHEEVEQLNAGSGTKGVQAGTELAFEADLAARR